MSTRPTISRSQTQAAGPNSSRVCERRDSVVASNCALGSLKDDVNAVQQAIRMQDERVLLVGHSWGGAIITETANEPKICDLGYIAAEAPDSGQSFNDWWKNPQRPALPKSSRMAKIASC
jgi:pimeloyl-ACP methyl ester carboxylesterase